MDSSQPLGRSSRFVASLPALIVGLYSFGTAATNFFMPVFMSEHLGFSGAQIGILYALQAIAGLAASFPAGFGNDLVTSRNLVTASLVVMALTFGLMTVIEGFPLFAVDYFVWALGFNVFRVSLDVHILKVEEGRGVSERVLTFQTAKFAAVAVGTALAGFFIAMFDFVIAIRTVAVICLVLAGGAVWLPPTRLTPVKLGDYKRDFKRPVVLLFALWGLLFATHWGVEFTCYGLFLRQTLGLGPGAMGLFIGGEYVALTLVQVVMLVKGGKVGLSELRRLAIVGLVLSGVGHVGMVWGSVGTAFAFRFVHGLGDGVIGILFYLGIAQLFHVDRMGGNTGLFNLATMVGMVLGALVASPLGEAYGYDMPILASGVIMLLLVVPLLHGRIADNASKA